MWPFQRCQLALQTIDPDTKRISFSDKALNCVRYFEKQAFDILDRIQLLDLSVFIRFAHNAAPYLHLGSLA